MEYLQYGCINSTVSVVLENLVCCIGDWYVLVYMFDSTPNYRASCWLDDMASAERANVIIVDGKLVMRVNDLVNFNIKHKWFAWYDQLYFFEHMEDVSCSDMHITSELPLSQEMIEQANLANKIFGNKIVLAIGDGDCGLNYITTDPILAEKIAALPSG